MYRFELPPQGEPPAFFRFRSTKALLGPFDEAKGQFAELERQEIYFASPSQLNDPMEGFNDIFWSGDEIVWRNFFEHYLYCLTLCAVPHWATQGGIDIADCANVVYRTPREFVNDRYKELFEEARKAFSHQEVTSLIVDLASRKKPVWREELLVNLVALNKFAVSLLMNFLGAKSKRGEQVDDASVSHLSKMRQDTSTFSDPDLEDLFANMNFAYVQQNILNDLRDDRTPADISWAFLRDFPAHYVQFIEKLIHPDWFAACFVSEPINPSMWGSYADGHRGVCLVFSSEFDGDKPALKLDYPYSWNSAQKSTSVRSDHIAHHFQEVAYGDPFAQTDFFRTMGEVPRAKLINFWYAGLRGARSTVSDEIFADKAVWQQKYRRGFQVRTASKRAEWSHEKESRLVLTSELGNFSYPSSRRLRYKFSNLAGVIFGMRTPHEDKLRILRIIEKKCAAEQREDFAIYQSRYDRMSNKMEIVWLNLLGFYY